MFKTTPPTAPADETAAPGDPFDRLPLSPRLLQALTRLGYLGMTAIQAASLPLALAGHDLIAQAKTGSGKTAAFALPLLTRLNPRRFAVQAMVLCPTRELADQVTQEIRRLASAEDNIKILTLCGGSTLRPQRDSLEHGAHIVVGTPGRLIDHLERGSLKLDALNTLVLDEADRMLDMGFYDDIAALARRCPAGRQTLLFSATYPEGIARLAGEFLRAPREVKLLEQHAPGKIRQRLYEVGNDQRLPAVGVLLRHYRPVSTLAFCNTRAQCRELHALLRAQGFHALTLHGELEQRERDQVLIQFANRSCSVLVATDVAARGLDIERLEAVINVDITPDPEIHIHRIGRTGRADEDGWAFSLCSPADRRRLAAIEQMSGAIERQRLDALPDGDETSRLPLLPPMVTLQILGGRREKIRPGDILGALTGSDGGERALTRDEVGKITVTDQASYVAIARAVAGDALRKLAHGRIKGRAVKVRAL